LWSKLDVLSAQSLAWRAGMVGFACLLLLSIATGVEYMRWLNGALTWRQRLDEIDAVADPAKQAALKDDREAVEKRLIKARKQVPRWHRATSWIFRIACGFAALGLAAAAEWPLQPLEKKADPPAAQIPQARFTVTYSAVHQTAHGREAHTFLLDQSTGDLWQMICASNGLVSFQHIYRRDYDGKPELPHRDPSLAKPSH
jgi:hypothetical protein